MTYGLIVKASDLEILDHHDIDYMIADAETFMTEGLDPDQDVEIEFDDGEEKELAICLIKEAKQDELDQ